ncbi:Di-and tricarboxylate transporter [Desulfocicer vacuolatum DSM 3385]|uniref:Di-and tricarboxylate transporter n=1 Tax=Desulfocicer vacuolatum DSM 3385 TaxID=1121400 RepID=A0A1W2EWY0_9BACT|nr:SLC13 family permease [Desulfocicer vacuolatum]SMD14219.1 Di-and tricarboxylate transporter [Desulfocicer vacuolatum DSM 3385]
MPTDSLVKKNLNLGKPEAKKKSNFGKSEIGLFAGLIAAMVIWNINLNGLLPEGQKCLALSLMTVIFWATGVAHSGYISGIYLIALVVLKVAPSSDVFSLWTTDTIYLIIGAYLIAGAVKSSGLGERIGYKVILKFVSTWKSVIFTIFILTFVLSLLIPHPWPRAFLIMSVMGVVIKSAKLSKEDSVKIGLTIFASSVPISLIFLTGDSIINVLVVKFSGIELSWLGWLLYMGVPATVASVLTYFLILSLFKPSGDFSINKDEIKEKLTGLGSMSEMEKRAFLWISIAVVLWMTDSIHGIALGWVTLLVAMGMSLPIIGKILTPKDWSGVPLHVLLFVTAAISIGKIGGLTGMNSWIASVVLPSSVPANPFIFALLIALIGICLHMVLGSVIAVMGIAIPALISFTTATGMSPLVPALLVYSSIAIHYVFPFHHLNMLVGLGEVNGMYSDKDVIKLGIPLTGVVFIVVLVEIIWWNITGLL